MKRASVLFGSILGAKNDLLSLKLSISADWKNIVGEDLCKSTSLKDIKRTHTDNSLTVIINTTSSASVILKYSEDIILKRMQMFVSYAKINKIIFKHGYFETEQTQIKVLQKKELEKSTIDVELKNKSLQNALEILKSEIQNAA